MKDYVKSGDLEFAQQLNTFRSKISTTTYATLFGLTPAQIGPITADSQWMMYVVMKLNDVPNFAQDWTKLKDQARNGGDGTVFPPFPIAPDVTTPPTPAVLPDIEGRFRTLVTQIKANSNYSKAIGEDLGIEAPVSSVDPHTLKVALKVVAGEGGHPLIKWKKGPTSGVHIWVDRNSGGNNFQFLATDTVPDYLDTYQLPAVNQSQVWMYKAIYFTGDVQATQWSDPVSFTVKG